MGHNCMALSLQTDAPRPLQEAGAMLGIVPWLMTRVYKRRTLEEEPQQAPRMVSASGRVQSGHRDGGEQCRDPLS